MERKKTNKNTKFKKLIYCIVFIVLLCLPLPLSYALDMRGSEAENRALAEPPVLSPANYRWFSKEFEAWFTDYLPFKDPLTNWHSNINYRLFKVSPIDRVVVGKDGWLFYNSVPLGDGDVISDYIAEVRFTPEELALVAENVNAMQKELDEKGIEFYIFIPCNKPTVYGKYMPDYIKKVGDGPRAMQLIEYLRENTDTEIIFPMEELRAESENYSLYYKYDTHWNELGAVVGTNALLSAMGKEGQAPDTACVGIDHMLNSGDLTRLMNMDSLHRDDPVYDLSGYLPEITLTSEITETDDPRFPIVRYTSNSEDTRSIIMLGDSFYEGTQSTFPKNFKTCTYIHRDAWNKSYLDEYQPDIVVMEIVERVLYNCLCLNQLNISQP